MDIKVMMNRGCIEQVLRSKDCPADLEVEIVHVDPDYPDYEQLQEYREKLYADQSLVEAKFSSAHFGEDEP